MMMMMVVMMIPQAHMGGGKNLGGVFFKCEVPTEVARARFTVQQQQRCVFDLSG